MIFNQTSYLYSYNASLFDIPLQHRSIWFSFFRNWCKFAIKRSILVASSTQLEKTISINHVSFIHNFFPGEIPFPCPANWVRLPDVCHFSFHLFIKIHWITVHNRIKRCVNCDFESMVFAHTAITMQRCSSLISFDEHFALLFISWRAFVYINNAKHTAASATFATYKKRDLPKKAIGK